MKERQYVLTQKQILHTQTHIHTHTHRDKVIAISLPHATILCHQCR